MINIPVLQFFGAAGHAAEKAAETGHGAEPSGIGALGIDVFAILAQAATFLLLFILVKKFALDKIAATLEERRQTIDNGVRLGQKMEAESAKLEETVEERLRQARTEADKILAEAHSEAGSVVKAAEVQASAKVDDMIAEAHAKINEDMKKARKELEADLRGWVADATAVVLREKLDAQTDEALLSRALHEARS